MYAEFEPRAPRLRCRDCGRTAEVSGVCHHCGEPICAEHDVSAHSADGSLVSREFAGLDLDNVRFRHCERCHHVVKGRLVKLIVASGAAAVLGLVLIVTGTVVVGLPLLLVGLGLGTAGYFGDRSRKRAMLAARPPLPLVPTVESAQIVERVSGLLVLDDDGKYSSEPKSVDGSIDLKLKFGRQDRERLDLYRKKYQLGPDWAGEFRAGYLMLHGRSGIEFDDIGRGTVRPLTGSIAEQPFFGSDDARANAQWEQSFGYRLDAASRPDHLPLWLTPSLMPEQDKRTIELEFQWIAFRDANEADLEIESLEELRVDVPVAWGNVESVSSATADGAVRHHSVSGGADASDGGAPRRTISWKQCALSSRERRDKRLTVSVRFEKQIDTSQVVRGHLKARFKGTVSGLTEVEVVHPLGGQRRDVVPDLSRPGSPVRTEVEADFELSLRRIRYQAVRTVPDRRDGGRPERTEFRGIIPDYDTVIELTNAISEHCYVKRVLENPPRSSGKSNAVNRYWNIAGRRYSGVFPVDFQIILTGEENNPGGVRSEGGDTIVDLTVTGSYANDSMYERIGTDWKELQEWVFDALESTRVTAPIGYSEPVTREAGSEYRGRTAAPRHAGDTDPEQLSRKLRELREALISGKISEAMYERFRAELEQEFGEY